MLFEKTEEKAVCGKKTGEIILHFVNISMYPAVFGLELSFR